MNKTLCVVVLAVMVVGAIVIGVHNRNKVVAAVKVGGNTYAYDMYMVYLPPLIQHHAPYRDDTFPLPPFAMLFVAPMTWLSRPTAQVVWACCKPLMFVPIFLLAWSMV